MTGPLPAHVPLAVATRAGAVESVHYGSIVVCDGAGRSVHACGDPDALTWTRSTLKPFQALALLSHPGFPALAFEDADVAIVCASHSGEPRHAHAVLAALARGGAAKEDLACGTHAPLYLDALGQRPMHDDVYTPLHHNCSGKHAGMLALAGLLGAPLAGYLAPEHPVQQCVRGVVAAAFGIDSAALVCGVDGCGAPNYAVPLARLATAYAWLGGAGAARLAAERARVCAAMTGHAGLVSGLKRLDLLVMHAGRGDWVAKSGADGVQALAIRSHGLGIAIKIADGAPRAREVVTLEVLRQLGLRDGHEEDALALAACPPILNHHGVVTGDVRPVFTLRPAGV